MPSTGNYIHNTSKPRYLIVRRKKVWLFFIKLKNRQFYAGYTTIEKRIIKPY